MKVESCDQVDVDVDVGVGVGVGIDVDTRFGQSPELLLPQDKVSRKVALIASAKKMRVFVGLGESFRSNWRIIGANNSLSFSEKLTHWRNLDVSSGPDPIKKFQCKILLNTKIWPITELKKVT